MQNYKYKAIFEHGGAEGEVLADNSNDAKTKVSAMYSGVSYDTHDEAGNPIVKQTVVTDVNVTLAED